VRIYPAPGSDIYDRFFQIPRLSNRVLYRFLYEPTIQPLPSSITPRKERGGDLQSSIEPQLQLAKIDERVKKRTKRMPSATRRNSMRDSEEPAQCDDKSLIDNNM